ncbi:MAG: class I SAM-dependent methyltransferase [Nitrospirae bacterium]|nr:class I SAM-dependent methyltransferase [Nitrospirota bacterium]
MKFIDEKVLERVGFSNTLPKDYLHKEVILRDGRDAILWVHQQTGHGILDVQFWEKQNYYSEDYRNEFGAKLEGKVPPSEHLMIYKELNEKQFQIFSSNLKRKTKFLEIGCSFGGILNKVTNAGVAICHGIEPNMIDAGFLLKNNRKAKIFNTTFEKAELPIDYYDIIVSIEVLEHVISPRSFLKKCFDVLRGNGLIYIEVPNHNDVLLSIYKNSGYQKFYYHKAHIHYFTRDSLQLLCRESGFDGSIASFLMYPFFNHIWWHQNHKPQSSAVSALSTPVPTEGNTSAEKAVNNFYQKVERDYDALINANMLGDCLIFQGRRSK